MRGNFFWKLLGNLWDVNVASNDRGQKVSKENRDIQPLWGFCVCMPASWNNSNPFVRRKGSIALQGFKNSSLTIVWHHNYQCAEQEHRVSLPFLQQPLLPSFYIFSLLYSKHTHTRGEGHRRRGNTKHKIVFPPLFFVWIAGHKKHCRRNKRT